MFVKPSRVPHIWQARIVTALDGFYRGAENAIETAEWADCAMIHDDLGETWGTVAWLHDKPGKWWLGRYPFYQDKGWPPIMGAEEIQIAAGMGAALFLVETPESYVTRSWCGPWEGPTCCILDWRRRQSIRLWLSLPGEIICETDKLTNHLGRFLDAERKRPALVIKPSTEKETDKWAA